LGLILDPPVKTFIIVAKLLKKLVTILLISIVVGSEGLESWPVAGLDLVVVVGVGADTKEGEVAGC
jgi:hypothetical protein